MATDKEHTQSESYTLEEILQDEYFISSMKNPTHETEEYWEKAIKDGRLSREDYITARHFIGSVQVRKTSLGNETISELWEKIENTNKTEEKSP